MTITNVAIFSEQIGAPAGDGRVPLGRLRLALTRTTAGEFLAESAREMFRARNIEVRADRFLTHLELGAAMALKTTAPATEDAAAEGALAAFSQGQVLLFWNQRQITDPDEELDLLGENEAVFVRLIPLKGG